MNSRTLRKVGLRGQMLDKVWVYRGVGLKIKHCVDLQSKREAPPSSTPGTNVTLCVNSTQRKEERKEKQKPRKKRKTGSSLVEIPHWRWFSLLNARV